MKKIIAERLNSFFIIVGSATLISLFLTVVFSEREESFSFLFKTSVSITGVFFLVDNLFFLRNIYLAKKGTEIKFFKRNLNQEKN